MHSPVQNIGCPKERLFAQGGGALAPAGGGRKVKYVYKNQSAVGFSGSEKPSGYFTPILITIPDISISRLPLESFALL